MAFDAAQSVAADLGADAVFADLNTSSPALKRDLATAVPGLFADVALMGSAPRVRACTPALASGSGGERFAELFRPLGMPVEVVGASPGDAAGLKLLRSVFLKGVAAAAIESLEAARAAGAEERIRADLASVIGEPLLERLLSGSSAHAARRVDEMRPPPRTWRSSASTQAHASAAAEWLEQLRRRAEDVALPSETVAAVLDRLGVETLARDLDGLRTVYAAWCGEVPFDNTLKLIHLAEGQVVAAPGSSAESFFASGSSTAPAEPAGRKRRPPRPARGARVRRGAGDRDDVVVTSVPSGRTTGR